MANESHSSADEVHIEQLEVFTVIGVLEHERKGLQRLTVSISFWPYEQAHDLADNIEKAVNYSAVAEETKRFAREQAVNLIETLADRLAAHLLADRLQVLPLRRKPARSANDRAAARRPVRGRNAH